MKKNLISILIIIAMTALMFPMSAMAEFTPTEVDLIAAGGDDVSVTVYSKDASGDEYTGEDACAAGSPANAANGSANDQCIVQTGYDGYLQVNLGSPRIITRIEYDIQSDSDGRWYNANYVKIELSNDAEFRDDPADDTDVVVVYLAYDKYTSSLGTGIADLVESIDVPSGLPAYQYVRVSRLNNSYDSVNYADAASFGYEAKQVSVAELGVYGYTDSSLAENLALGKTATSGSGSTTANITDGSTSTNATDDSGLSFTIDLESSCKLNSVVVKPKVGTLATLFGDKGLHVTLYNSAGTELATYDLVGASSRVTASSYTYSVPDSIEGVSKVKVSGTSGLDLYEVEVYGYNLFDEFARLDISDDGTTVSARAKYDESYLLVLAEYNSSGRCLQVKSTTTTDEITMTLTEGNVYKAFLWNSFTDRIPLTSAVSLTK